MAIRQVFARDVRASSSALRSISHFTPSGPRNATKAAEWEAKRARQAELTASGLPRVAPDGRVRPAVKPTAPVLGSDGKPTLFAGPAKFAIKTERVATTLSGLYPSVPLANIEDEPLPKIVKVRAPGTPMKKQQKPLGRIQGSRIDASEFASRLPLHRSTLYTIAARAGLHKGDGRQVARRRAYDGEFEDGSAQVELAESSAEADDLEAAILQVLTHPSFFESTAAGPANAEPIPSTTPLALSAVPVAQATAPRDNSLLAATGRAITDLVLTEYLIKRFPNMPTKSIGYAVTALTNQGALLDVGRELGIGFIGTSPDHGQDDQHATGTVVRYRKLAYGEEPTVEKPELKYLAVGEAVRALVGLVYERQGMSAATDLVKRHFASRSLDFDELVKHVDPLQALRQTVVRFGLERPTPRILVESGRLSASATYLAGVYSGDIKLGEGSGSSLMEAQRAASIAGLKGLWFEEASKVVLSAQTFADWPMLDRPNWELERLYQSVAPEIGESEAITHSSAKIAEPVAIGGYVHEPLFDRKQLARQRFDQTHVLPRTVDSGRPISAADRRAKAGLRDEPDSLEARAAREQIISEHPASRSIRQPRPRFQVERSREARSAFQAGVGSSLSSSMPSPSP